MKLHKRIASYTLALIYTVLLISPSALAADVRISEFHSNPDVPFAGGAIDLALEPAREWVELQNTTTETLPIGGLTLFNSNGSQSYVIPAGATIAPNDRFVVCRNSNLLANGLVTCDAVWTWTSSLANAGGTISLQSGATTLDSVTYTPAANGVATQVNLDGTQVAATNTYNLTGEEGTPGYANDVTPPPVPGPIAQCGGFFTTANLTQVNWTPVVDPSSPVTYIYQSSLSPATNLGGSFTFPAFTSGLLSSPSIPAAGTPEGTYYVHVRALDNEGNTSAYSTPCTIIVDNTAPTDPNSFNSNPVISTPSNDSTVDVSWAGATDNLSGIDGYSFSFSMDPAGAADLTKDTEESTSQATSPALTSGMWYFHIRTLDNSGNWSIGVTYGPFLIDLEAPIVTVNEKTTSNTSPSIEGTVNDPSAVIRVEIDGTTYLATNNGDDTWILPAGDIDVLSPGIYDVDVSAEDEAGNIGVDATDEELAITILPAVGGGNSDVNLGGMAEVMPAVATITLPEPVFGFSEPTPLTSSVSTTNSAPVLGDDSNNAQPGENKQDDNKDGDQNNWYWWLLLLLVLAALIYWLYKRRAATQE